MAETRYNLERDLAEARAMAGALENYVRGDELYGSANGVLADSELPSLTLGALMLRLRRLRAQEGKMNDAQKAILTEIEAEHARVRDEWTMHYTTKLQHEATSRLKSLSAYVAECEDDLVSCAGSYGPAALGRTMVQEVIDALIKGNLPHADLDNVARREDSQLRRLTESSDFLWSSELQSLYPKDRFWWLYARPRTRQ